MAENPENRFAKISEADIENIKATAIPSKTKEATKYGVKLFKVRRTPFTCIQQFTLQIKTCKNSEERHNKIYIFELVLKQNGF